MHSKTSEMCTAAMLGYPARVCFLHMLLQRVQWLKPEDAQNPRDIIKVCGQLANNTHIACVSEWCS